MHEWHLPSRYLMPTFPFDHCKIMTPSPGFGLVHHSWTELLGPTFSFFFSTSDPKQVFTPMDLTHCRSALMGVTPCQLYDLYTCPPAGCTTYGPDPLQILLLLGLSPIDCTIYASDPYIMYYLLWTWPPAGHTIHRTDPMSIVPFYTHDPSVVPPVWTWPTAGHIPLMHGTDPMLIVPSVHLAPAGCTPMNLSHCT